MLPRFKSSPGDISRKSPGLFNVYPGGWRTPLELLPRVSASFFHVEYIHVLYMDEWSVYMAYISGQIITTKPPVGHLKWRFSKGIPFQIPLIQV